LCAAALDGYAGPRTGGSQAAGVSGLVVLPRLVMENGFYGKNERADPNSDNHDAKEKFN
jgi:hypothetical protein